MTCQGPDCTRRALWRGLCRGHYAQERRGQPLRPLEPRGQTPTERLREAALAYAEAEEEREVLRAEARLRMATKPPPRCTMPGCGRRLYAQGRCWACWRASREWFSALFGGERIE